MSWNWSKYKTEEINWSKQKEKKLILEFVNDLKALPYGADYIQNKLHVLTSKWEEKLK